MSKPDTPVVVLGWYNNPLYIAPPTLSPQQYNIYTPFYGNKHPTLDGDTNIVADRQDYDFKEVISHFKNFGDPDLVCIQTQGMAIGRPVNLNSVSCPKVLLLGDTHHLNSNPILSARKYAIEQKYNAVISLYNKDHLRWFSDIDDLALGYFPGFGIKHIDGLMSEQRVSRIAFVGMSGQQHRYRRRIIKRMEFDNLPLDKKIRLNRRQQAILYSSNVLSFNCSLNGDLNMRVFEILSAGGCLITDRLSHASGMDDLFHEGTDYLAYSNYSELRAKIDYYLSNPSEAYLIARNGYEKYHKTFLPQVVHELFLNWALDVKRRNTENFSLTVLEGIDFDIRLQIYEASLTLQLEKDTVHVLAIGSRAANTLDDLTGLSRNSLWAVGSLCNSNMHGKIKKCRLDQIHGTSWGLVIYDKEYLGLLNSAKLRFQQKFEL